MALFRRLLDLVKPYWGKLGFAMTCMLFVSLLTASQAFLVNHAGSYLVSRHSHAVSNLLETKLTNRHPNSSLWAYQISPAEA